MTFGIINSQIVSPHYLTYQSAKLHHEYKIVFASDLHIGRAQPMSVSLNTIDKIKAEQPDYLILGGDVID